jgi:alkanesulfonate monooxygenase SsuD/methylene tetrahydromethanopterin reductase-like flavin-dependent oxidoreductase (luciferase family)
VSEPGVRIGLLLPTREAAVAGRQSSEHFLELAELAEKVGYDSVWAGDSPVARPRLDPLVLLGAVAGRTEKITLGTAVLLAALRPPVLLAQNVATLDRLADGRLILGLGAGFPYPATQAEFSAIGVPFSERVERLLETVRICRLLWSPADSGRADAAITFEGRFWRFEQLDLFPKPEQTAGPPLWLAGAGPSMLRRVGLHFDGWLPYSPTIEAFSTGLAEVRTAAARAERDLGAITPALYATVMLDEDAAHAERELERYVRGYYGLPLEGMRQLQAFYAGGVEGCIRWLGDYIAAGARHLVLRFGTLSDPSKMVELAAEELLPAIRAQAPALQVPAA